jgi:hypothetical protein
VENLNKLADLLGSTMQNFAKGATTPSFAQNRSSFELHQEVMGKKVRSER